MCRLKFTSKPYHSAHPSESWDPAFIVNKLDRECFTRLLGNVLLVRAKLKAS